MELKDRKMLFGSYTSIAHSCMLGHRFGPHESVLFFLLFIVTVVNTILLFTFGMN